MNKFNKKVLIVCPYTYPSACGIWARAYSDAKILSDNGYYVTVFSSNRIKGTNLKSVKNEDFDGLKLRKFRVLFSFGENALFWPQMFFSVIKLRPAIIHVHGYRHPHTLFALFAGKLLGSKTIITTHAPFDKDPRAPLYLKMFDKLFDLLIGWWQLKLFNKVIRITNWEEPHLEKLGIQNSILIPNSINSNFLKSYKSRNSHSPFHNLLYMGRIDPVKNLEWVKYAAEKLSKYNFKIHGPIQGYNKFESSSKNLKIVPDKYSPHEFIEELKESDIFLLPSIKESFGIVSLEAMAMGNILIANRSKGPQEYIVDGENGFLIRNEEEMVEKIEYIYNNWSKMPEIIKKANHTAEQYSEDKVGKLLLELYTSLNIIK
ncbi:MAG: glycosyltransferase family 4 protein [Candidatus Dojkabacteria bacterium]